MRIWYYYIRKEEKKMFFPSWLGYESAPKKKNGSSNVAKAKKILAKHSDWSRILSSEDLGDEVEFVVDRYGDIITYRVDLKTEKVYVR